MEVTHDDLHSVQSLLRDYSVALVSQSKSHPTLPPADSLSRARSGLLQTLPLTGHGLTPTISHLIDSIGPGFSGSSLSPNYYGFVTGGLTPAARLADNIVTLYDQNTMVDLPDESIATIVEDRALLMLMELLNFEPKIWPRRSFTTGATSSNVLGLACGREWVLQKRLTKVRGDCDRGNEGRVGELGLLEACREAGIDRVQVLTTMPHSSLRKAASILGLGRASVVDVGLGGNELAFDMPSLERALSHERCASIIVVSCGEVNTGGFATHSKKEVLQLKGLCEKYGAWLHVDGAFGIFARTLTGQEFAQVASGALYLELAADSIAGDAHKLLNVPYDCGFFLCRHVDITQQVFQNPNAAYLNTGVQRSGPITSSMNNGVENSRRLRGLPVYATLMAYGRTGYVDMLERQVRFARAVASYLDSHDSFQLLPKTSEEGSGALEGIYIIVLFRAKDAGLNQRLVSKINESRRMYVSGTIWESQPASRIAVSNWQADPSSDLELVKEVLEKVVTG
ncbi:hypothetical protein MMC30_009406 [Trapelia coarctata]|nr:hypothetical protein [Trapelia coarctata]